jgi:hypothetical protein
LDRARIGLGAFAAALIALAPATSIGGKHVQMGIEVDQVAEGLNKRKNHDG